MRVLVGYERSGIVREAFRKRGHDAWSCDIAPAEDGSEFHYQTTLKQLFRHWYLHEKRQPNGERYPPISPQRRAFWDIMIVHPVCTYLSGSGLHWNKYRPDRSANTEDALSEIWWLFTVASTHARAFALENPVGCIRTRLGVAHTQMIQPYQFGDDASKRTCLWLRNLVPLRPTKFIEPRLVNGKPRWGNQTDSGQNKLAPSPHRAADRARTYPGIANAMASQWGSRLLVEEP